VIDPVWPIGDANNGASLFQLRGGNGRLRTIIPVAAGMTVQR